MSSAGTRPLQRLASQYPLATFVGVTFAYSWLLWAPTVMGYLDFILNELAAFGPTVGAVVVLWARGDSIRDWLHRALPWRVGLKWYAAALVLPLTMTAVLLGSYAAMGNSVDLSLLPERLTSFPVMFVLILLLGGGQEEPGWRGFALQELQQRTTPVLASVYLGLIWAAWHYPLFLIPGSSQHRLTFPLYALLLVGLSIWFTWLVNRSRSGLAAMALHAGVNTCIALLVLVPEDVLTAYPLTLELSSLVGVWVPAAVLLMVTRGRLGRTDQSTAAQPGAGAPKRSL